MIFDTIKNIFSRKEKGLGLLSFSPFLKTFGTTIYSGNYLETYGKSLYVYACVSKIAEKVASIPVKLFSVRNSKGDVVEIFNHPLLDLIYRPNPFQTKSEFFEGIETNLKLTGNSFIWKMRAENGKILELWNLRPDLITIVADEQDFIKGYKFRRMDGKEFNIPKDDMIHIKYPCPLDEYWGQSPLGPTIIRVETEEWATNYQRDFFRNSARPDGILKTSEDLTEKQIRNIKRGWDSAYKGKGKFGKTAVLYKGIEYQAISMSQREMDFIESMKFTRDDILTAFKVPKPLVAVVDDVNRANAETSMYIFLSETIKPEITRLIEKINEQMVYPDFDERLFLDYDDPTPENKEADRLDIEMKVRNNIMTINEARDHYNLPPIEGGDTVYLPIMNAPIGEKQISEKMSIFRGRGKLYQQLDLSDKIMQGIKSKKKSKGGKKKSFIRLIKPAIKKSYVDFMMKRIDKKADLAKSKLVGFFGEQETRIMNRLRDFVKMKEKKVNLDIIIQPTKEKEITLEFISPLLTQLLKMAGQETLDDLGIDEGFVLTERFQKAIDKRAKFFSKEVNNTTFKKLKSTLAEGMKAGEGYIALSDRIRGVYKDIGTYRADLISRTESTNANNEGTLAGYNQSKIVSHKEWIAIMDDRTRPEHASLNGEVVANDKSFSNGLMYPQEPNCRCTIGPVVED
jgi:HK97 family phage portal protein